MRLQTKIARGIISSALGAVYNRFKVKPRRNTLFFEDIMAEYIRMCDEKGHSEEMEEIAKRSFMIIVKSLLPDAMKLLPATFVINNVARELWRSIGMLEDIRLEERGTLRLVETKGEVITRTIGRNAYTVGFHQGILQALYGKKLVPLRHRQNKARARYEYELKEKAAEAYGAITRQEYNRLNEMPAGERYGLKDAISSGLLSLDGNNRIRFRGKSICYFENTAFHIISSSGPLLHAVPDISRKYFSAIVADERLERKLMMIKTLLQAFGWGIVTFEVTARRVLLGILGAPYGFQKGENNWRFIALVVLGFMQTSDRGWRLARYSQQNGRVQAEFRL